MYESDDKSVARSHQLRKEEVIVSFTIHHMDHGRFCKPIGGRSDKIEPAISLVRMRFTSDPRSEVDHAKWASRIVIGDRQREVPKESLSATARTPKPASLTLRIE
jgi:hypothetical protein